MGRIKVQSIYKLKLICKIFVLLDRWNNFALKCELLLDYKVCNYYFAKIRLKLCCVLLILKGHFLHLKNASTNSPELILSFQLTTIISKMVGKAIHFALISWKC